MGGPERRAVLVHCECCGVPGGGAPGSSQRGLAGFGCCVGTWLTKKVCVSMCLGRWCRVGQSRDRGNRTMAGMEWEGCGSQVLPVGCAGWEVWLPAVSHLRAQSFAQWDQHAAGWRVESCWAGRALNAQIGADPHLRLRLGPALPLPMPGHGHRVFQVEEFLLGVLSGPHMGSRDLPGTQESSRLG